MAANDKTDLDKRALSTLVEQHETFEIETQDGNKKTLCLYPLQLGRLAMISQRLIGLDISLSDDGHDAVQKMWKICTDKPQQVAEIIAIATLRTKRDIEKCLTERTNELLWSPTMTTQAYSNLLYLIVFQSYHADFMSAIRSVRTLRVMISQQTEAERIAHTEAEAFGDK